MGKYIKYEKYIILSLNIMFAILSIYNFIKGSYELGASLLMICFVINMCIIYFKKDILHPISTYSIFWFGFAAISVNRLSDDQKPWSPYMWSVIIVSYFTFIIGYYLKDIIKRKKSIIAEEDVKKEITIDKIKLLRVIKVVFYLSIGFFIVEAAILGFIPIFSDNMSAYKDFHIKGIHYFVVCAALIPMLCVIYKSIGGEKKVIFYIIFSYMISVAILSRQLLIMQLGLHVISYHYLVKKFKIKTMIVAFIILAIAFSLSFNIRKQDDNYIKSVMNFRDDNISLTIKKPYMYIAMNFENLRNIVENFNDYQYGTNVAFPVFAFTNTKKFINYDYQLEYRNNPIFTTSTYMSDIYFDFGFVGVLLVPLLLGLLYRWLYDKIQHKVSIVNSMYFVLLYCLAFCFFVNWYTNATIWFYMGILFVAHLYVSNDSKWSFDRLLSKVKK